MLDNDTHLSNDTDRPDTDRSRGRGVLEGAFALLDVLGSMTNDIGLSELAKNSGLPKTTVHRLLDQLSELGAVERSSSGYRIGSRVFRLGQGWQTDLRDQALRTLRALSMRIRETVGLAMAREGRILIVASSVVRPDHVAMMRPGMTVPLDTASGKVIAAYDPLLGMPSGLSAEAWSAAAYQIRAAGVAYDREEVLPGVCCAAVPVRTGGGRVVGSLAVVVPSERSITPLVGDLVTAAQAIGASFDLGGMVGKGQGATADWRDGAQRAVGQ
ncbi:MAG TPA: IclR family transcriptional regulator [Pseudonocardiaceae bacterium]